ncbi:MULTISPECIES: cysteine-rich CWC family protein [unclassified Shewanella]|uniref:cysteine-rich CWC family protein n=1 Tax=unclassified Shewanella TaxID=196818 RepID=UPI0038CD8435
MKKQLLSLRYNSDAIRITVPQPLPEPQLDAEQLCPLCQGANQCAMTLGADISDCWCTKQAFPKLTQLLSGDLAVGLSTGDAAGLSADKLAQLLSQPAMACICETCLSRIKLVLTASVTSEDKNSPSGLGDGLGYEVK